jgi:hypothetical protein
MLVCSRDTRPLTKRQKNCLARPLNFQPFIILSIFSVNKDGGDVFQLSQPLYAGCSSRSERHSDKETTGNPQAIENDDDSGQGFLSNDYLHHGC